MPDNTERRNVFISHHHKDDTGVTGLTQLLARHNYEFRNSSVRLKALNKEKLANGIIHISDEKIRRILKMKISWAKTVVVLIGEKTHTRKWVNWEIEEANRQGKRIVGVYEHGGTENNVPDAFKKYGSALVGWNADGIIAAIDGLDHPFQKPDGSVAGPMHSRSVSVC